MTTLRVPDPDDRAELATFVGRAVRLDAAATVRLRAAEARVTAWATTPFDVLATRTVPGALEPDDVTAPAVALLTALEVDRAETLDLGAVGPGAPWRAPLPEVADGGWAPAVPVPAAELEALTDRGLDRARDVTGPLGPPPELLDETAFTVGGGPSAGDRPVRVPLRCLFALSGLGLLGAAGTPDETIGVSATRSWLRLDARHGAVVRRRVTALPLLTA